MKSVIGSTTFAIAVLLGTCPAFPASAAVPKCGTRVGDSQRLLAINAVQNLVGRYSHDFTAGGLAAIADIFATKTPGFSWKVPQGPDGAALQALFEKAASAPRTTKAGSLHMHTMFSPVIEVAADGKSAMGVWDSFGPNINSIDQTNWEWNKYGVDFIKEGPDWKIWHMQVFPIFLTPYDRSPTETAKANAAAVGNAALMDTSGRSGWTGPKDPLWTYDGKTPMRGPRTPTPYCTYLPELSAAQYAKM